jgi:hypothetical protein
MIFIRVYNRRKQISPSGLSKAYPSRIFADSPHFMEAARHGR